MNDRAAFRTAAIVCVLLCLIWDLATVVLVIVLPVQLAAIGLLYWGADGLVGMRNAGSARCPGHGLGSRRQEAGHDGQRQPVHQIRHG